MSSNEVAISIQSLSKSYTIAHNAEKHYRIGEVWAEKLKNPFKKAEKETFWALKDISVEIAKGDVVGIIGRNGAGKSTLLKVLSRITEPTSGQVDLYGRVGSLLEVGTGFHPELTGRENIFMNGAILGMRRKEIRRQFDAIVEFAGVEKFLDTPVKRYSSGMYVRLAFAVAAHLNPEILVVDEVLAVGDAEFQKKCLGKMKDVATSGRTVLFVSHNMSAISNLCRSCLVLRSGGVQFYGGVEEAVQHYLEASRSMDTAQAHDLSRFRASSSEPWITSARMMDEKCRTQKTFLMGSPLSCEVAFRAPTGSKLRNPVLGIVVNHSTFGTVGGVNTRMTGFDIEDGPFTSGVLRCTLPHPPLLPGEYTMDLFLGDGPVDVDVVTGFLDFHVEEADIYRTGRPPFGNLGVNYLEPIWDFEGEKE